ncbi:uncharacterized protein LOC134273492 isoform X2 [Saccostrea cucullata]|uniref:uncharacterized protein LOC134273492 isoform X2 n=1 Tax=Saccostrea cuccullata TaxID=36930 RepID=UPI002ED57284
MQNWSIFSKHNSTMENKGRQDYLSTQQWTDNDTGNNEKRPKEKHCEDEQGNPSRTVDIADNSDIRREQNGNEISGCYKDMLQNKDLPAAEDFTVKDDIDLSEEEHQLSNDDNHVNPEILEEEEEEEIPIMRPKKDSTFLDHRVSCQDLGKGEYEGWLYKMNDKKGFLSGQWKKYWCVIKNGGMYIYIKKEDTQAKLAPSLSVFEVLSIQDVRLKYFAFKIFNSGSSLVFGTGKEKDRNEWIKQIRIAAYSPQRSMTLRKRDAVTSYVEATDKATGDVVLEGARSINWTLDNFRKLKENFEEVSTEIRRKKYHLKELFENKMSELQSKELELMNIEDLLESGNIELLREKFKKWTS